MRTLLTILIVAALAVPALALDFGRQAPVKGTPVVPENVPVLRQGGDTIADAFVIDALPFSDTGTTAGYTNDYDEVCPYTGSTSPDVVYAYTPTATGAITADLCNSSYDTKVYVYDSSLALLACNDDFYFGDPCFAYSSRVEDVAVSAGETYYIIVDGYGGSFGDYQLDVTMFSPCALECPANGVPEGEPPIENGYVDVYNGGCGVHPDPALQPIAGDLAGEAVLCGVSGWYHSNAGASYRDTDWFALTMGPGGSIEVTGDAEQALYLFELYPQDCNDVAVVQNVTCGPCETAPLTLTGYAQGEVVWFWTGPTTFDPPSGDAPQAYDYICWFTGLEPAVATEPASWSTVKALF